MGNDGKTRKTMDRFKLMCEPVEKLITILRDLNGKKLVTISNYQKQIAWQYDFHEDGGIGHNEKHEADFRLKLFNSMRHGGSIVVRQYTNMKINDISVKKIYGILLGDDNWFSIPAREMELAYCIDTKTGKRITKEENVIFASL